jgi:hypothetical protein
MFEVIRKASQTGKKKMIALLVALVSFAALDGLLTQYLVPKGKAREANPFLVPLVGQTGFVVLKIVGTLLCALILWDIYRRFPRVAVIAAWIAVIGYGIIVIWNTSLIFLT